MIIIVTIIIVIFCIFEQTIRWIRFNQMHVMKCARIIITVYRIQHFRPAHYARENLYSNAFRYFEIDYAMYARLQRMH